MHGKVVSMKPAALQRKKAHKDVKALDSEQNQIQVSFDSRHVLCTATQVFNERRPVKFLPYRSSIDLTGKFNYNKKFGTKNTKMIIT